METYILVAYLILLIPIANFLFLGLMGKRFSPRTAGLIGIAGLSIVACLSYFTAFNYFFSFGKLNGVYQTFIDSFHWLKLTEKLSIDIGVLLDPISVMMLVVISTVSLMVHIYSLGYMMNDDGPERGFQRYYSFLSLFTFSMLGLVVATNIFQMYIFWELVGVSSYLLIGFYYWKPSAVLASKKAFIVTRFADLGFLIGILILSYFSGTFDFSVLTDTHSSLFLHKPAATFMGFSVITWAMALIFMGGAGKSAMLPLHIWLPDAMEGPTPVSALIHAATMVVAGVYLVARLFPIYFVLTPNVLTMIAYIGAITALFSAIVACTQTDIKRVLAFSTISQIAYMMVALGVSNFGGHEGLGYMASMFHLFTHAFFKSLLFLGAGAVIHVVHSNEMSAMGSLRKYMPITHITFLIACLSISGIPPFSGFFSKDEILVACFQKDLILFATLYFVAGLTAFYMFRLYFNIFWGKENTTGLHLHEVGKNMTYPLIFLATLTVVSGFIPFSKFVSSDKIPFELHTEWIVAIPSILIGLLGIFIAKILYKKPSVMSDKISNTFKGFYTVAYHKFYFDELWMFITKKIIFGCICEPIKWFDRHVVDGFMNFQAWWSNVLAIKIKGFQSGNVQEYASVFAFSILAIAALLMIVLL